MASTPATHTQQPTGRRLTFGKNYAVLNLDLMSILIDAIKDMAVGKAFVSNCTRWNDAVHQKDPRPLTIFSSLSFTPGEMGLGKDAPFSRLVEGFGSFATGPSGTQIAPDFKVDSQDIILQKTRWYAGAGNSLKQILRTQNIDTVIVVCLFT